MELTERQKIQQAKLEAMKNLAKGISVDFKPILNKIKELVRSDAKKEDITREVNMLLSIITQLEKFSELNNEEK